MGDWLLLRNLMWLGNVAPPKPTMPDNRKLSTKVFLSLSRQLIGCNGAHSSKPSQLKVMQASGKPDGCGMTCSSMAVTVPEVGACMAAETVPSASANNWPLSTLSPTLTNTLGKCPTCWRSGRTNVFGVPSLAIGRVLDSALCSGGCTPPLKA